jgi:hypothetical protein
MPANTFGCKSLDAAGENFREASQLFHLGALEAFLFEIFGSAGGAD